VAAGCRPGCIHTDLLRAGKIPDPFYRDNEQAVQWVGETNWLYRRTFASQAKPSSVTMCCCAAKDSTRLAEIKINGQQIGRADNMFRTWEFDAKPALKAGEKRHRSRICFAASAHEGAPGQTHPL